MGKHKKHHKKEKKHKKKHRKSSSSEDEWVEKPSANDSSEEEIRRKRHKRHTSSDRSSSEEERIFNKNKKRDNSSESSSSEETKSKYSSRRLLKEKHEHRINKRKCSYDTEDLKESKANSTYLSEIKNEANQKEDSSMSRDVWMDLPTSFLTVSNEERRKNREERRKIDKQQSQYNPKECSRELNPYWRDGGDGLPKFQKPSENVYEETSRDTYNANRTSNWKKKKADTNDDKVFKDKLDIVYTNKPDKTEDSNECMPESVLSEKELNSLAAKLVKAEIMGNTELIMELKNKLDEAREVRKNKPTNTEEVILTHTDSQGRSQPIKLQSEYGGPSNDKKKKKSVSTHQDGQRVRYFADDDKYSLKQMFENEKYNTVEDQNSEFIKMASKTRKNDDLDDIFTDNIRKKESDSKIDTRNRDRAIQEHQKVSKSLDNCYNCIQSELMLKHLMVSMGETAYLGLPQFEPLTDGHCLIVPIRHVSCSTQLDENEWYEILNFRRALVQFFKSRSEDVIFFETAMSLFKYPHMNLHCIPLPKEEGDMAPIYFKKAIDESETEWAQNKKLVSLKGRDVRKAIPKGLPYFFVSFGMEEGFAHVIEDENTFPSNFAQEIIGGMLDLHHSKWRKPKRQSFEEQSKRVLNFSKEWKKYDCTLK